MRQAEPSQREKEEGRQTNEDAIEDVDLLKGDGTERPSFRRRFWTNGETDRLRQEKGPNDKMEQLVSEGSGKRKKRQEPH